MMFILEKKHFILRSFLFTQLGLLCSVIRLASITVLNILAPILNITDEKTDKNISFEAGTTPLSVIKNKVDNDKFAVAFILKPIPISALKEVVDNNRFMPPKSTYIEPKLRSGLTIYSLD